MSGPTRFVILSAPRTGSNVLVTYLNSHPDIICQYEAFDPSNIILIGLAAQKLTDIQYRNDHPIEFLHQLYDLYRQHKAVGFKLFPGHNADVLDHVLNDVTIRKVILRRDNKLQSWSSHEIARQTEQWGVYGEIDRQSVKVEFRLPEFKSYVRRLDEFYKRIERRLSKTKQKSFVLEYADLHRSQVHHDLLCFLDVPGDVELETPMRKQNPSMLRDRFDNYDAVKSALTGTAYAKWLPESDRISSTATSFTRRLRHRLAQWLHQRSDSRSCF